jgi:hypothetical protein
MKIRYSVLVSHILVGAYMSSFSVTKEYWMVEVGIKTNTTYTRDGIDQEF